MHHDTVLDSALSLASAGYWVFPCSALEKKPAVKDWQRWATRDVEKIQDHWSRHPNHNIGIFTGRYGTAGALIAVDIDAKGKAGAQAISKLEAQGKGLPETFTQKTPTGGAHKLYLAEKPVRQGVDVLGPGVDIRSDGGYVVAAGSATLAGEYTAERVLPPTRAPQWLVEACGATRPTTQTAPAEISFDQERATKRAVEYLQHQAPIAIEGAGGDQTTFKVAARLKDFGCSEDTAARLMIEHYNSKCLPPWSIEDIRQKVRNAYAYGVEPIGASTPEAQFTPVATKQTHFGRLHFELLDDINWDSNVRPLVDGLLDTGTMSVLYGESNTGKTFVALDIGFHIALGREWNGRPSRQGASVYVASEGGGQIKKRVVALRKHYESAGAPFALVPCTVDLSSEGADVEPLVELIRSVSESTKHSCEFVVIDTLARAMGGGNENAPDDMGAFVRNVDRIRTATGAHLMIVHHSGKDKARGARGHSSLRAATDTEIEVANNEITVTKQRDMEIREPIGFALQTVDLGSDSAGRSVTSCVVVTRSVGASRSFAKRYLNPDQWPAKLLAVLRDIAAGSENGRIPVSQLREEFISRHHSGTGKSRKVGRTAFDRALNGLKDSNWVHVEGLHVRMA